MTPKTTPGQPETEACDREMKPEARASTEQLQKKSRADPERGEKTQNDPKRA